MMQQQPQQHAASRHSLPTNHYSSQHPNVFPNQTTNQIRNMGNQAWPQQSPFTASQMQHQRPRPQVPIFSNCTGTYKQEKSCTTRLTDHSRPDPAFTYLTGGRGEVGVRWLMIRTPSPLPQITDTSKNVTWSINIENKWNIKCKMSEKKEK